MFTFGVDGRPCCGLAVEEAVPGVVFGLACGRAAGVVGGGGPGWRGEDRRACGACAWVLLAGEDVRALGRSAGGVDQFLGAVAAVLALLGWEPVGGAALVVGLAGLEGVVDADVAGDQGGGGEQRDRGEAE